LRTTVVGSYPIRPSNKELMGLYFQKDDPYLKSLAASVQAQLDAGIDVVSDGQTRGNMVEIFASKLDGVKMRGKPTIVSDIKFKAPITLDDQLRVKERLPPGKRVKGIVTGPYTMAMSCRDDHYGSVEKAAYAFAEAMNHEALALQEHVEYIQLDEPFFSVEFPEYGRELVQAAFKRVECPRALHVCGDVAPIFPKLVEFGVDILDHEFAVNSGLVDTVKEYDFKQQLGYGCVRSDVPEVEGVDEIAGRVRKAVDAFGPEKLWLDPDCGLGNLPEESARGKLTNMVKARDEVIADV